MATPDEALRKLTSGQTLTNAEKKLLGIAPTAAPASATAATPKAADPANQAMLDKANALLATQKARLADLEKQQAEGYILQGLNPDGTKKTATQVLMEQRAERDAARAALEAKDPLFNKAGGPPTAPAGYVYKWIGGTTTGQYQLYSTGTGTAGTAGTAGTGGTGGATGAFTWTDPDTGQIKSFNSAAELNAFVTTWSTKKSSDSATATAAAAAKAKAEIEAQAKRTAQQDFKAALSEMGLADLADTVDEMIRQDLTASQIKLELPKQPAYILRFPGMKALRDAGQAVNEATYISMEKGFLQTLGAYGLDAGVFGTRSELGKYISNLVSPREFEERVNIAKTRVSDNSDVVKQLKGYYPEVDDSAVISYLLNPVKGMDIIKKQVRAAEIGAAATFAGFSDLGGKGAIGTGYAESLIGATGTADLASLKKDFGQAKTLARTQSRLAGLEGQTYNDTEAVNAAIAQEQASILASQRRAERETKFRFGGSSGVGSTSLKSTTNQ
jgi:hypothetical protein